jgi:hypothetical protein
MKDITLLLIVLGVIHILSEVFRKDKNKKGGKYKYPQFPEFPQFPDEKPKPQSKERRTKEPDLDYFRTSSEYYQEMDQKKIPASVKSGTVSSTMLPSVHVTPKVKESASPWQGVLTPQVLSNAVVFAEIILPPRARRPFGRNFYGRR